MSNEKINNGFFRTKRSLTERFKEIFTGSIDDELYDDLTEALILSDIPYATADKILEKARQKLKRNSMDDLESVTYAVKESIADLLKQHDKFEGFETPAVLLVMGVNGVGKTTTIAKIANLYKNNGKEVMLAAADTFRAAASEQLSIWADRLDIPIIGSEKGQDAASVIYDAINSAKAKNKDLLICDTAGRLHNNKNLMDELAKIYRVCDSNKEAFNLYTIVVLDAMTGQNSLNQLGEFSQIRKPDGIVVTKIDGSAKGGIVVSAMEQYDIPVFYLGVGESVEDIVLFDADSYADAIL